MSKVKVTIEIEEELLEKIKIESLNHEWNFVHFITEVLDKQAKSFPTETKKEKAKRLKYEKDFERGKKLVWSASKGDPDQIASLLGWPCNWSDKKILKVFKEMTIYD